MSYDTEVVALAQAYKQAVTRILAELDRIDLTDISRANSAAALTEVSQILTDLNGESATWVAENIPLAARTGITAAIGALSIQEAANIARFSRINSEMVKAAVADTQADLLAVTQNVERRVRSAVRQVTAESMRANMAAGINGTRTISRDILAGLRKTLGDSVNSGIIDATGRRWRPEVYTAMVTQTKLMKTQIDATINESIARGALYGVISSHGAKDACQYYEGRIVKLAQDAPGNYPYIGDLPRRDIFHPCCKHVISPVRDPDKLSPERHDRPAEIVLPNASRATIPKEKLAGYALNKNHQGDGKDKAVAFEKALGYTDKNWRDLAANVQANLTKFDAVKKQETQFGQLFSVPMMLKGPNGKVARVTTAWIIDHGDEAPRLTSIYIDKKR